MLAPVSHGCIPRSLLRTIALLDGTEEASFVGTDTHDSIAVWSITSDFCDRTSSVNEPWTHCDMLPGGLRVLGPVVIVHADASKQDIFEKVDAKVQHRLGNTTKDGTPRPMYVLVHERGSRQVQVYLPPSSSSIHDATTSWNSMTLDNITDDGDDDPTAFLSSIDYTMLRCSFTTSLSWITPPPSTLPSPPPSHDDLFVTALETFRQTMQDPSRSFFQLPTLSSSCQFILAISGDVVHGKLLSNDTSNGRLSLRDVLPAYHERTHGGGAPYRSSHHPVTIHRAMSSSAAGAPVWTAHAPGAQFETVDVAFDVVVCVPWELSVAAALATLIAHLHLQINRVQHVAKLQPSPSSQQDTVRHNSASFALVQYPLHGGAAHPIGLWTRNGLHLAECERQHLHAMWFQPTTQCLFRPRCQWVDSPSLGHLVNVHVGIPVPEHVSTFSLVQGKVEYYHYNHNGVQDKGWGCAYRSLQSLASWLWWNHYTELPVPSHRDIQDSLVRMGDKPPQFAGSKAWIGSVEVSCRTIHCASGRDLPLHASTLIEHFDTHGTPVMMGGASLAFTVVGVASSAQATDMWLLILDPHYCGPDSDVRALQTKVVAMEGYKALPVGWRRASSFSASTFFNLCLPQRPVSVL
ncbi:hypothetical protein, variant 1 [Aphanomyces astaci]|uniref:UFSP1/2/DUB catalytic domain-containing protein n=1 Tax=Aphanomyces astaci TaxID=112090 RepID=W4GRJ6_APHAT|nr:hypothetical protein, variant 1 [Aphanomyces astaci]ETV81513.1 hypothetical protein, variant 1 [Aphanomyces astaci]|eukprot:XP_009829372.1 hypothetical protein, variant 1 [Aphanomyces astaci]